MSKKISYGTKAPFQDKPEIPVENKVIADDMNEIKEAVNGNADELDTAKQNIENLQGGQGTASADITNLKNRVTTLEGDNKTNKTNISNLQNNKVDKVNGKGLSTEDFTTELKTKLENLENYDDTEITEAIQNFNNRIMRNSTNIETLQDNVAKLQEGQEQQDTDIEAIKAENERLREDLNAFPSGQAEGEYITLKDSADSRFNMFRIGGNSKQETRSGKNKFPYPYVNTAGTIIEDLGDGRLILNGTIEENTSKTLGNFNLKAGNYKLLFNNTNLPNNSYFFISNSTTQETIKNGIISNTSFNLEEDIKIRIDLILTKGTYSNYKLDLMILEATEEDETFETYGATPSPEYPSPIQNVEGNANVTVCNKNFFKILNNINKDYITVNNDNTFTINGTLQKNDSFAFSNMKLKKGTYTFSLGDYSKITNCYYNIKDLDTSEIIKNFNYYDAIVEIDKDRNIELTFVIMAGTYNNVLITPQIEAGENKTAWIEHKEQNFIFPLQEGQKLMLGDYLASDGIHHKRKQIELPLVSKLQSTSIGGVNCQFASYLIADMKRENEMSNNFLCEKVSFSGYQFNKYKGYIIQKNFVVLTDLEDTVENINQLLAGTILEYELENETIEPYTPEQQETYNEIVQTAKSYKNVTNIYSPDPVSPVFSINYRKDIDAYIDNKLANVNAQILNIAGGN